MSDHITVYSLQMEHALGHAAELLPPLPYDFEGEYSVRHKLRVLTALAHLGLKGAVDAYGAERDAIIAQVRNRARKFHQDFTSKTPNYVELGRYERDIIESQIGQRIVLITGNEGLVGEQATYIDGLRVQYYMREETRMEVGWMNDRKRP